jgi:hypothetical protein
MSTLWDFLLELFRGTFGLADGTRVGRPGTRGISVILSLRELALEVALDGKRLGNSMPPSGISSPKVGGISDILVISKSSSDSLSSSEPSGLTR